MKICKLAAVSNAYRRSWFDFPRARDAFEFYLRSLELSSDEFIILPNYIGYSEREGSGVFDPIVKSGVHYKFYHLNERLEIDLDSLANLIADKNCRLLVLIHYFGYVDKNYDRVIFMAKNTGIKILEDQAHSLYTDFYGGVTGRQSDASIYSLHKMFPVEGGGALSLVNEKCTSKSKFIASTSLDYDIYNISRARRNNFLIIQKKLQGNERLLTILHNSIDVGIVPQTFPVFINVGARDEIYLEMNAAGYGVVSLYHTMIQEIAAEESFVTNLTSSVILNLPVHQDASEENLVGMCDFLLARLSARGNF